MKKLTSLLLIIAVIAGCLGTALFAADEKESSDVILPFTDVPDGKWYTNYVKSVYKEELMNGKTTTEFEPESPMTRAEFVAVLARMYDRSDSFTAPTDPEKIVFSDVPAAKWSAKYVYWAAENDLVNGYKDGTFLPDGKISRQEIATVLVRYFEFLDLEIEENPSIDRFNDTDTFTWAKDDIEEIRKAGLFNGDDYGNFNPTNNAKRAEIAAVLTRLLEIVDPDEPAPPSSSDSSTGAEDPPSSSDSSTGAEDPPSSSDSSTGAEDPPSSSDSSTGTEDPPSSSDSSTGTEDPPSSSGTSGTEEPPVPSGPIVVIPEQDFDNLPILDNDPNVENLGAQYDKNGYKISNVIDIHDTIGDQTGPVQVGGIGIHAGNEAKVLRTRYGTFVLYITETVNDRDQTFAFVRVTSEGSDVIFTDKYNALTCKPNIAGIDGTKIYVAVSYETTDWPQKYHIVLYIYDVLTGELTKNEHTASYTVPAANCHGYGYSGVVLDTVNDKLSFMICGGDIPGFVAWINYDINTGTWESTCHTIQLEYRCCYFNAYPDNNGGMYFLLQRDVKASSLGAYLGVDFFITDSYMWDAIYLIHIPDIYSNEYSIKDVYVPEYSTTEESISGEGATYYGQGASLVDSKGNMHIIYTAGTKGKVYYAVYDSSFNEIKNGPLSNISRADYNFALAEGTDGSIYIIAMKHNSIAAKIDIYKSTNGGKSFTKQVTDYKLQAPNAEGVVGDVGPSKMIVSGQRTHSDRDGTVGVIFYANGNAGFYDYLYFAIELP